MEYISYYTSLCLLAQWQGSFSLLGTYGVSFGLFYLFSQFQKTFLVKISAWAHEKGLGQRESWAFKKGDKCWRADTDGRCRSQASLCPFWCCVCVPSGAVFAAEGHWCHPGATEQQKLGMEVAWDLPALPQPVSPWGKQQGWLGMWGNDASTLGLGPPASNHPISTSLDLF